MTKRKGGGATVFLILASLVFVAGTALARNYANGLVLEISGVNVVEDVRFTPCYPVNGFFTHPDPRVTKIRMENPRYPAQFIEYPKNADVHIYIHENLMKQNVFSWSNFIAMDASGNEYGRILVSFDPPEDPENNKCNQPGMI